MSKIFHASLRGLSSTKERELSTLDIKTTEWKDIDIESSSFYLFIPQNTDLLAEYNRGWKVTNIFPINVMGFQTHRDHFAIDLDYKNLEHRLNKFKDLFVSDPEIKLKYQIEDGSSWNVRQARLDLKQQGIEEEKLIACHYRPFDWRYCYFSKIVMDRPRQELINHVAGKDNLCFNITRQTKSSQWAHGLVSNSPTPAVFVEVKDGSSVFPLYRYPTTQAEKAMGMNRTSNLSPSFLAKIQQNLGYQPTPEAIFHYIYAIFHSPTYRSRYAEFLKIDFPRVPLTSDDNLFKQLATLGEKLVNLHLMKSIETGRGGDWESGLSGNSSAAVGAGYPKYESGKVTINKQGEGFIDVPEAVWKFHVGGYQVCHKWLKDRKGRVLSAEDIAHYQGIVGALGETIEVMDAIDVAIPGFPIQ